MNRFVYKENLEKFFVPVYSQLFVVVFLMALLMSFIFDGRFGKDLQGTVLLLGDVGGKIFITIIVVMYVCSWLAILYPKINPRSHATIFHMRTALSFFLFFVLSFVSLIVYVANLSSLDLLTGILFAYHAIFLFSGLAYFRYVERASPLYKIKDLNRWLSSKEIFVVIVILSLVYVSTLQFNVLNTHWFAPISLSVMFAHAFSTVFPDSIE